MKNGERFRSIAKILFAVLCTCALLVYMPMAIAEATIPSSLDGAEEMEAAPAPTYAPDETLPGILGLSDAYHMRVLIVGTDAYTGDQHGRSDTMMLLQVNTQTGQIKLLSFLRDLYVRIPGHGKTRLNAAYVYGGMDLLMQTLQDNFGITVDRTLAVNFLLMVDLVDQLGGVKVDVSEKERKQVNSILKFYNKQIGVKEKDGLLEGSGVRMLTGKQALSYSRIRKIDSDFERSNRQSKVLQAVYERVLETEPLALAGILSGMIMQVETDMSLPDAIALLPVVLRMQGVQFDHLTIPVKNGYSSETVAGAMVLVPNLDRNRSAIEDFLQD